MHMLLRKETEMGIFLGQRIKLKQKKDTVITGDFTTVKISTEKGIFNYMQFSNKFLVFFLLIFFYQQTNKEGNYNLDTFLTKNEEQV